MAQQQQNSKPARKSSDTVFFVGGALLGALAGAGLGIIIWAALACFFTSAFLGLAAFLAIEAISIAVMSVREGHKSVKRHHAHQHGKFVDRSKEEKAQSLAQEREQRLPGTFQQPRALEELDTGRGKRGHFGRGGGHRGGGGGGFRHREEQRAEMRHHHEGGHRGHRER